ncbi:MAG: hypothetical protein HKP30_17140 [Myxococcales bacterium]|nr:hypothetical protein [Myxococcales bacterium]
MRRGLLDRLLQTVTPKVDASFRPAPVPLGPGLHGIDRRLRLSGAVLPTRSFVAEVAPGRLVVISAPPDPCPEIASLGSVATVVAPNSFHYVYALDFAEKRGAELLAAPGLPERVRALASAFVLGEGMPPPWSGALDFVVIGPRRRISELLFFHHASRTLILTDLAFNLVRFDRAYDRVLWRAFGAPDGFGPSRNAKRLLLADPSLVRPALRAVLDWPFERIAVSHGDVVEEDAPAVFRDAFAEWL